MHLTNIFWTSITYVTNLLTLSPSEGLSGNEQAPLLSSFDTIHSKSLRGPIFKPPSGTLTGSDSNFTCDYSSMVGFSNCSTAEDRGCWLRNETGFEYSISTDYEDVNLTPIGIHRTYYLNVTDQVINADGLNFTEGKVFNATYPGPWLQACWGDTVTVIVKNDLKHNGTSIHWHGIRQWLTMHMDGVNGFTQCPIAPGDSFNYTWRAMQYGSSWYHSHYSVQYADGALGPMTLHGPSSAGYHEAKPPILMTDWGHNSAFNAIFTKLDQPSILLNGRGNITRYNNNITHTPNGSKIEAPQTYNITFDAAESQPPKRYLLRLINTSFQSHFIFSIDNHLLQVVGTDFVPIYPYLNESVHVAIGQRYHLIVTAQPNTTETPSAVDGNYWIRTYQADCEPGRDPPHSTGYNTTGILRYNASSTSDPTTTEWRGISQSCSDEPSHKLKPVFPWTVGEPSNAPTNGVGEVLSVKFSDDGSSIFPLAFASLDGSEVSPFNPLRIDYGDPTFLHLNYTGKWNPSWVIIPENYTSQDWVYLVVNGLGGNNSPHPIHLHGHDFAILQQVQNATFPKKLHLKLDNPPRRDVVLLPSDGYVVIAFQTDNPGTWIMHCHIASHAAGGLAAQILERQQSAADIWPSVNSSSALQRAQNTCNNWNKWWGDCNNWWPGDGSTCVSGDTGFAPDSGV